MCLRALAIGTLLGDALLHIIPSVIYLLFIRCNNIVIYKFFIVYYLKKKALGIHEHGDGESDHDHDHDHDVQDSFPIWKMCVIQLSN